ncbi:MAG: type I DNA topoisomerase [Candidatus Omnitrophica bacterium]|nr:type I DNA topoisomerase [Candidatus Omnitrophota bacterium]
MAKNLIIVESPAKAKTIHKILGADFDVTSSMGHLVDLPSSRLGVDIEHDFAPHYIVIQRRRKLAKELLADARGKTTIYLAPDPDREGEAISWHLANLLKEDDVKQAAKRAAKPPKVSKAKTSRASAKRAAPESPKIYRITFHEITAQAVKAALQKPGVIDLKKVDAQQARRVLDRLVGYSLSPLLWKKVGRGLSAGRVQSVALRLIVDREKEIDAFTPNEYWTIAATLKTAAGQTFTAQVATVAGKKLDLVAGGEAAKLVEELKAQQPVVAAVDEKEQKRYPKPPFTTSTLQQEAFHQLGFSSARTMRIAQQLYEGLEIGEAGPVGLITYMRTDSVRVAPEAMSAVRGMIGETFGADYLPAEPRAYKSRKSAQEAHEAVRPTSVARTPDSLQGSLTDEQLSLYRLIWQRFMASQMADAVDRVVAVQIAAGRFGLKANGRTSLFAGWTKVYHETEEKDEKDTAAEESAEQAGALPPLTVGEPLALVGCEPAQHFTKPPRRYTDASLVKMLEELGIGRPSTYAPTIQTIVSRDYVRRTGGSLVPTALGRLVTDLLTEHFPEVMDVKFTAHMEEELDRVEEGDVSWVSAVRDFYTPFSVRVAAAQEQMKEVKRDVVPTSYVCDKCGKPMVIRWGRFGQFLSCSDYPACKNAKSVPTGIMCPQPNCGGDLVERRAKGRIFYGCSKYPACTYTTRRLPSASGAPPGSAGSADIADEDSAGAGQDAP